MRPDASSSLRALVHSCLLAVLAGFPRADAALSQDANVLLPVDTIEARFETGPLSVVSVRDTRFDGDRTQRVTLEYPDSSVMNAKWAAAPPGGHAFNNAPRYELACYELQKLFLPPEGYVVPPTAARAVSVETARSVSRNTPPTFGGTSSTVVVLQYWLSSVSPNDVWDAQRFRSDTAYARHVANLNVFTYLARHSDSNAGNFLVSSEATNPRVFAVDNGLSFESEVSDRGYEWRRIRVPALPAATVARLRELTRADLERTLGVLAEWQIRDGHLVRVAPGPNLRPGRGVRREGDRIQLGLTSGEISGVVQRLRSLLEQVDRGRIRVF